MGEGASQVDNPRASHQLNPDLLIVQLLRLIHIGKWTKLFRQVNLQVK